MKETKSADVLHSRVIALLKGWSGFSVLNNALQTFAQTEIFIAGGVLRDLFTETSRVPRDFDFFLGGPDVTQFVNWLGERGTLAFGPFGSPRWWPHGERTQYADLISIADFHNGLWKCRNIVDALNQFDFTANAVALDLRSTKLFNPQNGILDAKQRIMRAVRFDYPDEPISSECSLSRLSVLWTRLIHYANTLDFSVEPVTRRWLRKHLHFSADADVFGRLFFPPLLDPVIRGID